MQTNPSKRKRNKWLALINVPIQMGVLIFVFAYVGQNLDLKYPNAHNIYVKILVMVGVVVAFYNLNRQLKDINKMDDTNEN